MLNQIFKEKLQTLPGFAEHSFSELESQFLALLENAKFKIHNLYQARQLAFNLSFLHPSPSRIAVGLTELFINAIEHGNLGITFDEKNKLASESAWLEEVEKRLTLPENQNKFVHIEVTRKIDSIQFKIQDQGNGFQWQNYIQEPNNASSFQHGRGIILARLMSFDELMYNESGNCVTCSVKL